jgi:hypothetical protein
MGRPKRVITAEGQLKCSRCGKWKHITQYYHLSGDVWWIDRLSGEEYGKPTSWCIECLRKYQASRRETVEKEVEPQLPPQLLGPPKKQSVVTGRAPWEDEEE